MIRNLPRHDATIAGLLFIGLLAVYQANGDLLATNDAVGSIYLPLSVIEQGNLTFTADEVPFMFGWKLHDKGREAALQIERFDDEIAELVDRGEITTQFARYQLVETTEEGVYVNAFGIGAGLTAWPLFVLLSGLVGKLTADAKLLLFAAKLVASACVAASASFVFLAAARLAPRRDALLVAVVYGLGTCVWSTSSQVLMQHAPNEMFLAMAIYFLTRVDRHRFFAAACAVAASAAVFCRPTSAVFVLAIGGYLLWNNRRAALLFVLAGLPFAAALAAYNAVYLGSPWQFGQLEFGQHLAQSKTGSPDMWQTPLWQGLAGHLLSPSRGLLAFSPFFIFLVAAVWPAWRNPRFRLLWPLWASAVVILCIEAKHFDWWSGWSYGYRHLVDLAPILALLLTPAIGVVMRHRALSIVFSVLVAWSVLVQFVGAWAFSGAEWNNRRAYKLQLGEQDSIVTFDRDEAERHLQQRRGPVSSILLNVDSPDHRRRLWSLSDNQILYHLKHFGSARARRRELSARFCQSRQPDHALAETYYQLGHAWGELGDEDRALAYFRRALKIEPTHADAHVDLGALVARRGQKEDSRAHFKSAVEANPTHTLARRNLGNLQLLDNQFAAAAESFKLALDANPFDPGLRLGLAIALDRTGQTEDAIGHYIAAAVQLDQTAGVHYQLAGALARVGRSREAIESYRTARRLEPRSTSVLRELAWILATDPDATLREPEEAIRLARQACLLTGQKDVRAIDTLAAAQAAAGRFEDAAKTATRALKLAESRGNEDLGAEIQSRRDRYFRQKPYVRSK